MFFDFNTNNSGVKKNRSAVKIFLIYLVIGGLWILFSDMFLSWIIPEPQLQYKLQTPKGWFFILVTGFVLYLLIKRDSKVTEELYNKEFETRAIAEKANRELEESERKYKTLIEQAADGIFTTDLEGNFTDINEAGCKIFGYSSEELLSLNLKDIIAPEDLMNNPLRTEELKSGSILMVNRVILRKDKMPVNVEMRAKMLSGNFIQAIVRDVTDRIKAEQILFESEKRYKDLFKSNPNPMWVYDLETLKFLDVNQAAIINYGYSLEEFLSMTIKDIRPPEDLSKLMENLRSAEYGFEYSTGWKHLKKDGAIVEVEIRSNAIEYKGKKAKIVSAIDVTWRKISEEEIKKSREELRALASYLQSVREKERTAISRELHDELGQILTSIKMNLVMMGKELSDQLKGSDIEYFKNEINSMSELLDRSVKSVRKIITDLRPEVLVNLELIDALKWQVDEFNDKPGIRCWFNHNCAGIKFNNEITTAVFRIIQEALTNVRRHSGAKTVNLDIFCDEDNLTLSIKDDGIGMADFNDIKPKSFGLLGIRERAIILGGNLKIISNPDEGTELIVNVPLKNQNSIR
ncbi:MAG TPA: PAS domain S-box protein [Ignavibacteriaceae bacterium]|nr:PAS domain S-box protein [Ignavibacteriaceae bacterium]